MGYFYYIYVFRTNLIKFPLPRVIADPVKVEFIKENREYDVIGFLTRVVPKDIDCTVLSNAKLVLEDKYFHVILTARVRNDSENAEILCENQIDRIITEISILYSPLIFESLVYKGWSIQLGYGNAQAWVNVVEKSLDIKQERLQTELDSITNWHKNNRETSERFTLMSRFYAKALLYPPSEERFIFLWTVLEVFPMKDTSNIKPISEYLSVYTNKDAELVKTKLAIGKIYGLRCDIVHFGKFDAFSSRDFLIKLEEIVQTVLRIISGLPYDGMLDKYFDE